MTYLVRHLAETTPDIEVSVHRTRFSERPILKHVTVPLALAIFLIKCLIGGIDVVHINIAPRGSTWRKMLFETAARITRKPVILHLHGSGYNEYYASLSERKQARIRAFFARAAMSVALSEFWKCFMLTELKLDPCKVTVIANGVPYSPSDPGVKNRSCPPVISFMGLVGHRKGVDILLDALATPNVSNLSWSVIIGGDGEVEEARAQATRLGIADRIRFLGWVDEARVHEAFLESDIFCLPSRAENQPVSILEAMARGLPVVASDVGAIPDQVADGVTGFVVPAGDAGPLATALATLIGSREQREAFGLAGLKRFETMYSVSAYAGRFAELYRSLSRGH